MTMSLMNKKINGLVLINLATERKMKSYKELGKAFNITKQAIEQKVRFYDIHDTLKAILWGNRSLYPFSILQMKKCPGVLLLTKWDEKIFWYTPDLLFTAKGLYKKYSNYNFYTARSFKPTTPLVDVARECLRLCFKTPGSRLLKEGPKKFPGVCYHNFTDSWLARMPVSRTSLGYYQSFDEALEALKQYILCGTKRSSLQGAHLKGHI